MYAEELPGGQYGYGLEPGEATIPGPVLEMWEGDTLEIELVNTTDRTLSIHPHGVNYTVESDGSPMNDSVTPPGESRTYTWSTQAPAKGPGGLWMPGSAGYWHYHDHALGTAHGTEGVRKGLYGALVVRRKGDVLPDRQHTVVFNDMTINNRSAPEVPVLEANLGERVEFIAVGHGDMFHESGVATVEYALDDAAFETYEAPVTVSDPGSHTVRFRAVDTAGNTSDEGTVSFLVARDGTDACPASDERPTVVVGDIVTQVANLDVGNGCTINDLIDSEADYANHGAFVTHVRGTADDLVADGHVAKKDRVELIRSAARSDVGK